MKASSIIRSTRQLAISLRDARIAKGLTQTALAQQTGLGRPWINQLEQGKIENASLSRILALCNALEVTFTVSYEVPSTQDIAPYPSAHASLASNQNTFAETSDALSQTGQADCGTSDLVTIIPRAAQTISASTEIHIFAASATISRHIA